MAFSKQCNNDNFLNGASSSNLYPSLDNDNNCKKEEGMKMVTNPFKPENQPTTINSTNPFGSEDPKYNTGRPFEQHYSNKVPLRTREQLYGTTSLIPQRSTSMYPW